MKICVAQTRPFKGDIQKNIEQHKKLIALAVTSGADTIIFPELSLTGYEPGLAKELAITKTDGRLDEFQQISDTNQLTIGVGAPLKHNEGITISMIIFQPQKPRELYSKKYLHADEESFFISGQDFFQLKSDKHKIALAICYELSVPDHSAKAFNNGADIYIASVAKTATGVEKAAESLSAIAANYSMTVLMSNCAGPCDDFESGGKTTAWNNKGVLIGQLNDSGEGILMLDTVTMKLITKII